MDTTLSMDRMFSCLGRGRVERLQSGLAVRALKVVEEVNERVQLGIGAGGSQHCCVQDVQQVELLVQPGIELVGASREDHTDHFLDGRLVRAIVQRIDLPDHLLLSNT